MKGALPPLHLVLTVIVTLGFAAQPLEAAFFGHDLSARNAARVAERGLISSDEAVKRARKRFGGKVLSVRLESPPNAAPYYRVKLLSNGHVRVVRIPASR